MTKIRIFGDSHSGALRKAAIERGDDFPEHEIFAVAVGKDMQSKFFSVDEKAQRISTKRIGKENSKVTLPLADDRPDDPDIHYFYNGPLTFTMIANAVTWGQYVPWDLKTNDSQIPLSEQAMEDWFEFNVKYPIAFAKAMRDMGMQLSVIEGPRPFKDTADGSQASLDLIMAVCNRFFTYTHARLDEAGIPVIRQPKSTLNEDGTTKIEFDHEDPNDKFHCNVTYGGLILDELLKTT